MNINEIVARGGVRVACPQFLLQPLHMATIASQQLPLSPRKMGNFLFVLHSDFVSNQMAFKTEEIKFQTNLFSGAICLWIL